VLAGSCGAGAGRRSVAALVALLFPLALPTAGATGQRAVERTESRARCRQFDPLRQPYFGDLHVHSEYSFDAFAGGTPAGPRDVYAFAAGVPIAAPGMVGGAPRRVAIDRPLDFAAVTDHAEFMGEINVCLTPAAVGYDGSLCQILRALQAGLPIIPWRLLLGAAPVPGGPGGVPVACTIPGVDCRQNVMTAWADIRAAAEEAYDRTAACNFTSFIGYEYTAARDGRQLHRNVIFRNHLVPEAPISAGDTYAGGVPELWERLQRDCLDGQPGCDVLTIPHNPNLSGGTMWPDPGDPATAAARQRFEPLVELMQIKGASECRFDRLAAAGLDTTDERCTFEQLGTDREEAFGVPLRIDGYPRRNLVRNVLKDGLTLERRLGVNPFKLGFVGSTDTHLGAAGETMEAETWPGWQGVIDAGELARAAASLQWNPGGLAVVYAEENARDAIFSALKRRETYATSGTRPIVRFFGGWRLAERACERRSVVRHGYRRGVPMGGDLPPRRITRGGARAPRFAVLALKDPGTAARPGGALERIQIVKGWVDADGVTHERVIDVAGDARGATGVDPETCASRATGVDSLCTVWTDDAFDPRAPAFYYARVLEMPTCRWSTRLCKRLGVDPFAADCATQAAARGAALAGCCAGEHADPFRERVIQERAWTSPIWYAPAS
jgi:hypothetical protein